MAVSQISAPAQEVGECIYCGRHNVALSTEHAVPYGLNGEWTLLKASCAECAAITSHFERDALRGLLPTVRAVLGLRSRRRKERPQLLPLVLETDGVQSTVDVPLSQFPCYLPSPVYPPLGVVRDSRENDLAQPLEFRHVAGPTFEEIAKQFSGVDFVGVRAKYSPELFARMLAKVAYCAAVRAVGVAPLRSSGIREFILGTDRRSQDWVGSWSGQPIQDMSGLHAVEVHADETGREVHVLVSLFSQFGTPIYHIFVGRVSEEFAQAPNWPWK